MLILIFYGLSGFLMKFSDDIFDESNIHHKKLISSILAGFSGFFMAYLITHDPQAMYIFFTILIATLLALKIDGIHHISSLIVFIIVSMFYGFNFTNFANFSIMTLIICIISAYIDEWGNDNQKLYDKSNFLKFFFNHRFTMKITIFVLAILSLYQPTIDFFYFHIQLLSIATFIGFLCYDLAYDFAAIVFNKFFNKYIN